ncbi:uncharacterized protein LOC109847203 [Asparagus officinalis]|uniref:uncharacterized protein LOC109847203 n=1 Tax=Asparagus officinalis TaxID=4686 RepID=UPI00098E55E5|nr:uncharacterized protein LOC109847203 [Asparagus officinalis]
MKKDVSFEWDDACQNAFESIKKYLTCPPVLGVPIKGRPLILYTAALPMSLGALLAQVNDEGKEVALYYLRRMMLGAKQNYPGMEKICLALVFAAQKLRHYMLEHTIHLVSREDPLRYILGKLVLSGHLAKWAMFLTQFDIVYVPQKAVKGQVLADFLAAHALPGEKEIEDDLPNDEVMTTFIAPSWVMYFDGASRGTGAGAKVAFVTPKGESLPYSFTLTLASSNNEAEYEALVIGLELALDLHLDPLVVYGDSQLVIHQLNGKYAVKKKELIPYFLKAQELIHQFQEIQIEHVPRSYNHRADALESLAASLAISPNTTLQINIETRRVLSSILEESPQETLTSSAISAYIEEETDWRKPLLDYLNHVIVPADNHQR